MFSSKVHCPVGTFSNNLEKKICIAATEIDNSAFMTMTALLYKRVENFMLRLKCISASRFENLVIERDEENIYSIYWIEDAFSSLNPDSILKKKTNFKIEKLEMHEKFMKEQFKQPVFIRTIPEMNAVFIFTTTFSTQFFHASQVFIPKYFNIFKEKPVTEEEKKLLETLTYNTSEKYIEKIREFSRKEDFKKFALFYEISAFEKKLFQQKVAVAKQHLKDIDDLMDKLLNDYRSECEKRVEAQALLLGLENMESGINERTEFQDYLFNNKRICQISLDGSSLRFVVKTFLVPHHLEEWNIYRKKPGYFEQFSILEYNTEEIKTLLDAIFSEDRCMKLKMCAFYQMDYFGSEVKTLKRYKFEGDDLENYIPNPHLNYHECFSENKPPILKQLANGDAIGAIECAIFCAQRININEASMTFQPFVRELFKHEGKILVAENDTEMTVNEAIKYLMEKKNEHS